MSLAAGQSGMTALVTIGIAGPEIARAFSTATSLYDWTTSLWRSWRNPYQVALILWAGLGPEALAFGLQLYGQKKTAPSTAQV